MKSTNKKIILNFLVIGVLAVVMVSLANAIGFSSNDRSSPLSVYQGDQRDISINLFPASATEGNRVARVTMEDNAGIASITDASLDYNLVVGQNTPVNMKVSIPSSAAIGTEYVIKLKVTDVTETAGGGTVGLITGSLISVHLKVVEKPAPPVQPSAPETPQEEGIGAGWIILGVIAVIVLIIAIYYIIKSRKNS